ncbi:HPr family phosphocarrier protein [Halobellus marinus]|uniref:HPr family phosphocarrier protein n=2 Tax=Haloferacaceae TaxID=1644056 RepID=UPI0028A7C235|nr:HPr family phosphocarrier protein [Halobellus sp. DFY28]
MQPEQVASLPSNGGTTDPGGRRFTIASAELASEMATAEGSVVVHHETGLHARPASKFVQTASQFESEIQIRKDGEEANAKSSIAVISLGVGPGEEIQITAEGDDSEAAIERLVELVESDFELDS